MTTILIWAILAHIVLWLAWIPAANTLNYARNHGYTEFVPFALDHPIRAAWMVLFWPLDVYVNLGPSSVLFWQLPPVGPWDELWDNKDRLTLTHRLKTNLAAGGRRGRLAGWMCRHLVEPWDQGHCGL